MKSHRDTTLRVVVFVLLVMGASGCGKKYTVTGKVTRGGQPIEWQHDENQLLVLFAPADRKADPNVYRAESDSAKGTYVVKNVPPGNYLVSVQFMDPPPLIDALHFAFGLNNSPLTCTVDGDKTHDIDIPAKVPKGSKGPGPRAK